MTDAFAEITIVYQSFQFFKRLNEAIVRMTYEMTICGLLDVKFSRGHNLSMWLRKGENIIKLESAVARLIITLNVNVKRFFIYGCLRPYKALGNRYVKSGMHVTVD